MMMLIFGDKVDLAWPAAAPHLERAVAHSHGYMTMEVLYDSVKQGQRQLWLWHNDSEIKAALTTQLNILADFTKICCIDFVGGDNIDEWLEEVLASIESWAKTEGCDFLEGAGRVGWDRKLRSKGWESVATIVRKPIYGSQH